MSPGRPALPPSAGLGGASQPPSPVHTHPGSAGARGRPVPPQRVREPRWTGQLSTWCPGISMAAGPGLAVARQPGSDGPGPRSVPSPHSRGTDLLGAQAGSVTPTELPGLKLGVAPAPCQPPRGANEEVMMCTSIRTGLRAGDLTTFHTSHSGVQQLGCCSL